MNSESMFRKYLIKLLIFLSLSGFIIGCNSTTNLRVRSLGFLSCDLIFSVHDNCKEIPEKFKLNLSFESDHAGVSFARDNLTLAFEDFSETDQHRCKYTREIRIPYNIEAHGAKDFTWNILKDGEPWERFEVIVNECNETDFELEERYKLMQMQSKEKLKTERTMSEKIPEIEEIVSDTISQESQLKEIGETASKAAALQEIQSEETYPEPKKTEIGQTSSSEGIFRFRGLYGYGSFSESESSLFGYRAFWHNWGVGQSLWDFKYVTSNFNLEIDSISFDLNYRFEIPKSFIPLDLGGDGHDLTLGIGLVSSGKAKMHFAGSTSETKEIGGFDTELLFGQQQGSVEWLLGVKYHNRTFKNLKYGDSTYNQSLSWLNFQLGAGWLF